MSKHTAAFRSQRIVISEYDESGNVVATYIHSKNTASGEKRAVDQRVDVILPKVRKPLTRQLLDIFLPAGYPGSVTEDYLWYQIYDSLQAFSSSIAGLLSSRAVLEGVGVGDANATPTNALYLSIIQESLGRIATIAFAHRFGTMIEPECKMYRLLADVLNDAAMILDCLSPVFPRFVRVMILGGSSVLRSLCGVAAGSAKGCLSAHFATCGNLGELNAVSQPQEAAHNDSVLASLRPQSEFTKLRQKDSSQETVISLLGMLTGSLVVSRITSPVATWVALLILLAIHLATNYLAVRAVSMRSLNQQRLNIVVSMLVDHGKIGGPGEISQQEYIFSRTGMLRWDGNTTLLGRCLIGGSMQDLMRHVGSRPSKQSSAFTGFGVDMPRLLEIFKEEKYILWFSPQTSDATIVLKRDALAVDKLKAWVHALLIARQTSKVPVSERQGVDSRGHEPDLTARLEETLVDARRLLWQHSSNLERAGWDLGVAALETRSGVRVTLDGDSVAHVDA